MMKKRILSILLSFAMVATCVPSYSYAESNGDNSSIPVVPQTEEDCSKDNAVLDESTENMTVFENESGMKTAVIYSDNVRFKDKDGKMKDYDPSLTKSDETEYSFENREGDSHQYFPEKLDADTPIVMTKDDYEISMTPVEEKLSSPELGETRVADGYEEIEKIEDTAVYGGKGISFEYQSLSSGVKESIVLEKKPESNLLKSVLDTGELVPELQETGEVVLYDVSDKKEKSVSYIDSPFMTDSEGEYSADIEVSISEIENGKYEYALELDEEFLENASYPVTIDPTHTWKGDSQFTDVYVVSGTKYGNTNFHESGTKVMPAGIASDGHTYRTYVKFIDLKSILEDKNVKSAKLTVYENGSGASGQKINIYRVTESWTTSKVTWNNKPKYNTTVHGTLKTSGDAYDSHTVDITGLIQGFVNGAYSHNYGIAIRNANSNPSFASFFGSRTGSTSYRPKLVVTYYDKPTAPTDMHISRLVDSKYEKDPYVKKGSSAYVSWKGIESVGLAAVQYKVISDDSSTPEPTSVGGVNLTSYRSTGSTAASANNIKVSYSSSLPEGVYRVRIRGKDTGGMYGTTMSRQLFVDGTAPVASIKSLTYEGSDEQNAGTQAKPIGKVDITVKYSVSDKYLKETTVKINGREIDNISSNTCTISGALLNEGKNTILLEAVDKAGNAKSDKKEVYVDTEGPDITSFEISDDAGNVIETTADNPAACASPKLTWVSGNDTVKAEIYCSDECVLTKTNDASSGEQVADSTLLSRDDANVFTLRVYDAAGNVTEESLNYFLDDMAPEFRSLTMNPESSAINPSKNLNPCISWNVRETCLEGIYFGIGDNADDIQEWTRISEKAYDSYLVSKETFPESGSYTFQIKAVDRAGNATVQEVQYHADTTPGDWVPEIKSGYEYYGKRIITWEIASPDMECYRYDLYRGDILIAEDINVSAKKYVDSEVIDTEETLEYFIKVSERNSGEGNAVQSEMCSIDMGQMSESILQTNGFKGYLAYFEADLPQGNISIEKSSGNAIYSQELFDVTTNNMNYGLEGTYQSRYGFTGMLGKGWHDSYHREIYEAGDGIYFTDCDGGTYLFEKRGDVYECEEAENMSLRQEKGRFVIELEDGYLYTFNENGSIDTEKDANGNTLSYTYDESGRLVIITANQNRVGYRELNLTYDKESMLLEKITDYCGTEYSMDYEGDLLEEFKVSEGKPIGKHVSNTFVYDSDGKMTSVSDREENDYAISYSDGRASEVEYPDGERYRISYNGGTTKVEKENAAGDRIYTESSTYDSQGRLWKETDVSGNETEYTYSEDHPYLTQKTQTDAQYETLSGGMLKVVEDDDILTEEYYSSGNVKSEKDEDGNVTEYTYKNGYVIEEKTEDCDENLVSYFEYEYDKEGNVIMEKDNIADTITEYTYDECGNEISCIESVLVGEEYKKADSTTTIYDKFGNEEQTSEKTKTITQTKRCTYDEMGRCTSCTDENGLVTVTEYDYLGRSSVQTISGDGASRASTTEYTDNGAVSKESDAAGLTTQYKYDNQNRIVKKTVSGAGMDTIVETTSYGYGSYIPPEGGDDALCYIRTVTCGNTATVTYTDKAGNVVKEEQQVISVVGNMEEEKKAITTEYVYDNTGNMIAEFNPDGTINLTVNDEGSNKMVEVQNAEFSGGTFRTTSESMLTSECTDKQGNIISSTNGAGKTTHYSYDDVQRLEEIKTPTGNVRSIDYSFEGKTNDASDVDVNDVSDAVEGVSNNPEANAGNGFVKEIVEVTEHEENKINEDSKSRTVLDASGLELATDDISGEQSITVSNQYDESGRLVTESYDDGSYVTNAYDVFGNVIIKEYHRADESIEQTASFSYDMSGRMTSESMTDSDEGCLYERNYSYDAAGRILSVSTEYAGKGRETVGYSYDSEGRLEKVDYPNGSDVDRLSYEYDAFGNVISVTKGNRNLSTYEYDNAGRVISQNIYNGERYVKKSNAYDDLGRVSIIEYKKDNEDLIEKFSYEYDDNGYVSIRTHEAGDSIEKIIYTYDDDGRLIQSRKNGKLTEYSYDSAGNRVKMSSGDIETTYSYNGFNQLTDEIVENTSTGENISVVSYIYDSRGNLIREEPCSESEENSSLREYEYYVSGALKSVSENGSIIQTNEYDAEGIRISRSENGNSTVYYYGDNGIIYSDGATDNTYICGIEGTVDAAYLGGDYSIYATDVQGSTYSLIDESIAVDTSYTYSDFGETTATEDTSNEICYTGAVYDGTTGMYYMNARYYDPEIGRFISQDTYRGEDTDAGTWHLYAYCNDNPINYTDPSGHSLCGKTLNLADYRKIHNKVADCVAMQCACYKSRRETYVYNDAQKKRGFLDVYCKSTSRYYEVKSLSASKKKATRTQMKKYDGSHTRNSTRRIKRANYNAKGQFYMGCWHVKYYQKERGLIAYECSFNNKRYERYKLGKEVTLFVAISFGVIATGGQAAPALCFI